MNDPHTPTLFDDLPDDAPTDVAAKPPAAASKPESPPPAEVEPPPEATTPHETAAPPESLDSAAGEPAPLPDEYFDAVAATPQSEPLATDFKEGLNPSQLEAVTYTGGHCLVLAGAGSGKTRVLTHRIAWLIAEHDVKPGEILSVTFTNKAAAEMRGRVRRLIGAASRDVWLSTFHSLGLRLLREWSEVAGRGDAASIGLPTQPGADDWLPPAGFPVYNREASLSIWRQCQTALRISPRDYDPGRQFGRCSGAVSKLEDPASWDEDGQGWDRKLAGRVWKQYRAAMRAAGAVDFDDLLVMPLQLMTRHEGLRRHTAGRFRQLLIDEYQDTNRLQYRLIQALLGPDAELLVVGDEDQSIYRWRGADLNNVLDFQKDFPGAHAVRLEQNYRSTQPILSAAGSLVSNNRQRLGKKLWTDLDGGELPSFVQCATDREEADWIAKKVEEISRATDGPELSDMAVLYRTNAQSRQFEETFIRLRIPHRVVGGQRFFARREVRDILSYIQLLVRDDDVALNRALSAPSRGIGPKTVEALGQAFPEGGAAAALRRLCSEPEPATAFARAGFSPAVSERLMAFGKLLDGLRQIAATADLGDLIHDTIDRSGYAALLEREENKEDRVANLDELVTAAREGNVDDDDGDSSEKPTGLKGVRAFLDRLALLADADTDRDSAKGVRLMTVHAAKGLEFNVIFLTGMEEELFPHTSSIADGDVEEERRLCYVGMTRARKRLFMTAARSRRINGRERWQEPSRFISEIDPRYVEVHDYINPKAVGSSGYAPSSFTGLGGRTGQRQRSKRSYGKRPAARRKKTPTASPVKFSGPTRPATEDDLEEGATVVHPMFGPGCVMDTVGTGDKLKLEIRFNKKGLKTVVAKFAKLEVPE